MKPCIIQDTYNIFANSSTVRMNMGTESCCYEDPETQATELTFTHYPEEETAYLNHGRYEAKDRQSSAILYILELREVSETAYNLPMAMRSTGAKRSFLRRLNKAKAITMICLVSSIELA